MKILIFVIVTISFLIPNDQPLESRNPIRSDTVHFAKGSTLSFLIGIIKPDAFEARTRYFQAIFPIASKYQYNLGVAFNVNEPTRGNYHPGFVAIASWPNADSRQQFLQDPSVPNDLADQRRRIWSRFDQLLFENIDQEIKFTVREDKVYAFSSFWIQDPDQFEVYLEQFTGSMARDEGRFLVLLKGGHSPKNHLYEPNVVVISEWNDSESFKTYIRELNAQIPDDGTKNINEFTTSFVFGFGS